MSARTSSRGYLSRRPPIFRVKTGCLTCRGRKKKCDEIKPVCTGCERNRLHCQWPDPLQPNHSNNVNKQQKNTQARQHPRREGVTVLASTLFPCDGSARGGSFSSVSSSSNRAQELNTDDVDVRALSPGAVSIIGSHTSSPSALSDSDRASTISNGQGAPHLDDEDGEHVVSMTVESTKSSVKPSDMTKLPNGIPRCEPNIVARSLSLLPAEDGRAFELLGHYLSRTALSMGNGSTDVNPFISQLVPLSFTNNLILQLILCQSAAHRAVEDSGETGLAQDSYNRSLRLFRKSISDYISGHETNPLWIAIGALIMCFTETAKGDINGIIFDHIEAAGPLLTGLVTNSNLISKELKDFIVEYYTYTTTISMISIDPIFSSSPFLSSDMEVQAQKLVEKGYVGQLCGCWLELLLLIPRIFALGRRARSMNCFPTFPSADDFIEFSTLQGKIIAYIPSTIPGSEVSLVGNIFKQAVHLYLLISPNCYQEPHGEIARTIEASIERAFECLRDLSPTSRINTSLCWALAVIGSCLHDKARQDELQSRLHIMFGVLGLGNIRTTSTLLDHIWASPSSERNPWNICHVMQHHQMWTSFA